MFRLGMDEFSKWLEMEHKKVSNFFLVCNVILLISFPMFSAMGIIPLANTISISTTMTTAIALIILLKKESVENTNINKDDKTDKDTKSSNSNLTLIETPTEIIEISEEIVEEEIIIRTKSRRRIIKGKRIL